MGWQGEKCYLEMQESLNSSRCYFCYTCCPRDNLKPMLWQVLAGLFFNNFLDVKKLSKGIHHLKCAVIYMEFFRPFCLVIGCWFIRSLSPLGIHHFHLVWGLKVSLTHAHRLGTSLWLICDVLLLPVLCRLPSHLSLEEVYFSNLVDPKYCSDFSIKVVWAATIWQMSLFLPKL